MWPSLGSGEVKVAKLEVKYKENYAYLTTANAFPV